MKTINAYANIFGPIGYAHHARKFYAALNKIVPVCLAPKYGQLPPEAGDPPFSEMLQRLLNIDLNAVAINLDYPEEMFRFTGSKKIGYTVFETEIISASGMNQLKQLNQVWVPTQWGKEILVKNGLSAAAIRVVPEGVDTQVFSPEGTGFDQLKQIEGYKFLSVGKWEERKGIRELLQSFDGAFNESDQVYLVLYYPSHVSALQKINVNDEVNKLNLSNRKKVIVVDTLLPREQDMAHLYASCDAYVSASKAEGWGLPITEAMASGLPVIAPFYSGPTEYLTHENAICLNIDAKEEVYCPVFFPQKGSHGYWAKIDQEQLAAKMKWVYQNQGAAKLIGKQASLDMQQKWTWDQAAAKAVGYLSDNAG
ncbi:MAG: hypothetical protein ACD_73C00790G0002 [uncultured bacterium]|nr:MAG: hypothetical protein ACD_73C00790G0002 [uncultured bacterium]